MKNKSFLSLFSLIFLSLFLSIGCGHLGYPRIPTPDSGGPIGYTANPKPSVTTVVRPVFVDTSFKMSTKEQIVNAFEEWNIVLNGYQRFEGAKQGQQTTPFDFVFVNVTSKEAEEMNMSDGVLGWVDELGETVIYLIEDRMGGQDIRILAAHEMGHSLGLPHLPIRGTLMYPFYANAPCVDEITVRELVTVSKGQYDIRFLNYCNYKL